MSLGEYGLEEYIRDTNDAFEKGIPSNYGEQSGPLEAPTATPKLTRNTVKKWAVYQGYYYDTTHQTRRHLEDHPSEFWRNRGGGEGVDAPQK
jgi:homoserine trans-succinylase